MPNYFNKNLNKMIERGWRPSFHGEWLDCYNCRSRGNVAGTITTGISFRNNQFIVVKHGDKIKF